MQCWHRHTGVCTAVTAHYRGLRTIRTKPMVGFSQIGHLQGETASTFTHIPVIPPVQVSRGMLRACMGIASGEGDPTMTIRLFPICKYHRQSTTAKVAWQNLLLRLVGPLGFEALALQYN